MCGIAGWVGSNTNCQATVLVRAMTDILAHRGPDDEGYFFSSGVGLGHRRLSIIDLEHGRQPMLTEDSRFIIVYNGEIYNFIRLRTELKACGETFKTNSDTEVILRGFRQWGTDVFNKLQGMFAIAIWDSQEHRLHLVRDHLGIKPLYYVELGGELLFASEIKALFCHPMVKRQMDPLVIATFLSFNNTFGRSSFWAGVKRCQPGERIEWFDGRLEKFKFFDIGTFEVEPFKGDFQEAAENYKDSLSQSVTDHLISDVPVGAYLSGGLDSSSVATLALEGQKTKMSVFTGYFEGHENGWYDERVGAREVAKMGGMEHYECPISWNDFRDQLEKVAYHLDEPMLGSGAIAQYIVAKEAHRKLKVILTGHGGDELFSGYPVFKAAHMREQGFLRSIFSNPPTGGIDEWVRTLYFLLGGMRDAAIKRGQFRMYTLSKMKHIITESMRDIIQQAGGIDELLKIYQPFRSEPNVDGVTRWYVGTYLPTLLIQEDKISMAHGLEARVPICYKPLVTLALSLSGHIKIKHGHLKAVPRYAMQSVLPSLIFSLPKRGFPTPITTWLSDNLGYEWEGYWKSLLPSPLEGLLDPKGICAEFSRFRKWGYKMPNAYATAHRLISLQMLHACARTLKDIKSVENPMGSGES